MSLLTLYNYISDTAQGLKPRSFCLSRVVGTLRNAAWPRLGEYRSGQGKTETGHPSMPPVCLRGARPVAALMPFGKGSMAHTSRFWRVESGNTRIFRCCSFGNVPQRRGLFLDAILVSESHFLKSWNGYPYLRTSK